MTCRPILLCTFLILNLGTIVLAKERVVLTINSDTVIASFSIKQLEALPHSTIKTVTHWTEGMQTFEGVLLSTLVKNHQIKTNSLKAYALNNYSVDIPVSDLSKYPVLLAYKHNDNYIKIRNKGPLWVIYPLSDYPELNLPHINNRWIWQLKRIELK